MKFRHTAVIFFIFIGVLAIIGILGNPNCSQVGGCRNCWSTSDIEVSSDLCANPEKPCTAKPYLQQHNAVVDTLLCACSSAKTSNYADASLNKQIEDAYFAMRGGCSDDVLAVPKETRERNNIFCNDVDHVNAKDLCDSPGQYLAKRPYG